MTRGKQPYVAGRSVVDTVWRWNEDADGTVPGQKRTHRKRVLLQCCVMAAVGAVLALGLNRPRMGGIAGALAALTLVGGLFSPPLYRAIDGAGRFLGRGAAVVLTWSLLLPFFLLCFGVGRIAQILLKKDPMTRRPSDAATYWVERAPDERPDRLRRQF